MSLMHRHLTVLQSEKYNTFYDDLLDSGLITFSWYDIVIIYVWEEWISRAGSAQVDSDNDSVPEENTHKENIADISWLFLLSRWTDRYTTDNLNWFE